MVLSLTFKFPGVFSCRTESTAALGTTFGVFLFVSLPPPYPIYFLFVSLPPPFPIYFLFVSLPPPFPVPFFCQPASSFPPLLLRLLQ